MSEYVSVDLTREQADWLLAMLKSSLEQSKWNDPRETAVREHARTIAGKLDGAIRSRAW